ncbi:hypothetical protein ADUPG1_013821, partial [Aduncisulcus paluster]
MMLDESYWTTIEETYRVLLGDKNFSRIEFSQNYVKFYIIITGSQITLDAYTPEVRAWLDKEQLQAEFNIRFHRHLGYPVNWNVQKAIMVDTSETEALLFIRNVFSKEIGKLYAFSSSTQEIVHKSVSLFDQKAKVGKRKRKIRDLTKGEKKCLDKIPQPEALIEQVVDLCKTCLKHLTMRSLCFSPQFGTHESSSKSVSSSHESRIHPTIHKEAIAKPIPTQ